MNDELTKEENAAAEALVCAVRAFCELALVIVREFMQTAMPIMEAANEYYCEIQKHATPNERRMMHHRKKRIRRKYYNRVKRRIKMPEPPKEEGEPK